MNYFVNSEDFIILLVSNKEFVKGYKIISILAIFVFRNIKERDSFLF